jgi:hypothetical protein
MKTEQTIVRTEVGTDGDNVLKGINKLLSEGWKIEGVNPIGDYLEYLLEREIEGEIIIRPLSIDIPDGDDFFQNKEQIHENFTQILKNYPELINPNQYDLSDIFEKLKVGRSFDEQEYLNDCILKFKNK